MSLTFRQATFDDFSEVKRLRKQLCLYHEEDSKSPASEFIDYDEKVDDIWLHDCFTNKNRIIYLAIKDKRICSYAIIAIETVSPEMKKYCTWHTKAHLINICTDEAFRHQNIGSRFIDYICKSIKSTGAEFIELECYTGNPIATDFYTKTGFKDIFIKKRKYL